MKKLLPFLSAILLFAFATVLVNCGSDHQGLSNQFAFIRPAAGPSLTMAQRHFAMEHHLGMEQTRHFNQGWGLKSWNPAVISNGTDSVVLMNNDGTGEQVISQQGWFECVQESTDAKKGVGTAEDDNGNYQVFFADLSNKKNIVVKQLTSSAEYHWSPSLSFDGKTVVFVKWATSGDSELGQAFLVPAAGGSETQITTTFNVSYPTFTPDGKIVFEQEDTDAISIMNKDGTGFKQLTNAGHPYFDEYPSVSPDGKTIVFSRYPATESGGEDIWVVNIDGTNEKQLTTDGNSWDPMFVNNKIVFISSRDGATSEVYSMDLSGSNQKRLTNDTVNEYFDVW